MTKSGKVTIVKTNDAAEGTTDGLFTVTLGGQSPLPTIVKLEVLPAVLNNATSGTDYVAIGGPFKTITFNPFQTQVTVPVDVIDDGISEATESVIVEVDSVFERGLLGRSDCCDGKHPVRPTGQGCRIGSNRC